MNWDDYEIYNPGATGALNSLSRAEARRAFDRLMAQKPVRIKMLRRLLDANGLELSDTDDGILQLNEWFRANVEADPANPGRLTPGWYSVVNDVALFLGDVLIERCPALRWEFFTAGKTNVAYQRHVVTGFARVPNPKFNLDIDGMVAGYAHRVVAGHGSVPTYGTETVRGVEVDVDAAAASGRTREIEGDAFWRWVKTAESKA